MTFWRQTKKHKCPNIRECGGGGAMEVQIMFYKQHIIAKMTSFAMPEASQKLFLAARVALYLPMRVHNLCGMSPHNLPIQ